MLVVRRAVAGAVSAQVRIVVASKLGGRNKTPGHQRLGSLHSQILLTSDKMVDVC